MAKRNMENPVTPNVTHSWVAVDEWNGLTSGDPVKVTGERGDFKFISAHIKEGEAISIIVHGGVYGHVTMRAFYPHRINRVTKRKKREQAA